ncbi:MAG: ATP-binding protein [Candidatus Omnitrophota bacterium]|jgi:signal transduction histidine kinase
MTEAKTNILIIGAGQKAKALIELFINSTRLNILGVIDADAAAPGIKLAKQLGIATAREYKAFLGKPELDEIINLTGNQELQEELIKQAPKNVKLIGKNFTNLMQNLIDEHSKLEAELRRVKDELEIQAWGLKKTNEGIKILYKELEKKNKELEKLDQLKSDFLFIVSHELRTPLTTIRETVSQVLDGVLGATTEQQRSSLSICLEDIDRLARIISNLLDISKIEQGKIQVNRKLIDIVDLGQRIYTAFCPQAKNKGLELKTVFSQERIEVYADKDKIIQVFNNLLGNSLKFTKKGYIQISVVDKQDCVECSVSDTGRGIAEEELPKAFSKFQQFGREPGPGEKGTGLGLAISKGIIELHRGTIWVESAINKGSKFIFTLPKYTARELFREHVTDGVKEAIKQEGCLSILIIHFKNFSALQRKMSKEKIKLVLRNLEEIVESRLSRKEDVVIRNTQVILVVFPAISKEKALTVADRLEKIINDYFSKQELTKDIEIAYKILSYPEDGKTDEQLFSRIASIEESK